MYEYRAWVVRVVDGDTIDCDVDLGFRVYQRTRFRLARIDAPEPRGDTRIAGKASRAYLAKLIEGLEVVIQSERTGKWGRWLAEVFLDGRGVNDMLVEAGHAKHSQG